MKDCFKFNNQITLEEFNTRSEEVKQSKSLMCLRDYKVGDGNAIKDIVMASDSISTLYIYLPLQTRNQDATAINELFNALISIIENSKTVVNLEIDVRLITDDRVERFFKALKANTMIKSFSVFSGLTADMKSLTISTQFTQACGGLIRNNSVLEEFHFRGMYVFCKLTDGILDALKENKTLKIFNAALVRQIGDGSITKISEALKYNNSLDIALDIALNKFFVIKDSTLKKTLECERNYKVGEGDAIKDIVLASDSISTLSICAKSPNQDPTAINELFNAVILIIENSKTVVNLEIDLRLITDNRVVPFFKALTANTTIKSFSVWCGVPNGNARYLEISTPFTQACGDLIRNNSILEEFHFTGMTVWGELTDGILDALKETKTLKIFDASLVRQQYPSSIAKIEDVLEKNRSLRYISFNDTAGEEHFSKDGARVTEIGRAMVNHPYLLFTPVQVNYSHRSQMLTRQTYFLALTEQWLKFVDGEQNAIIPLNFLVHRAQILFLLTNVNNKRIEIPAVDPKIDVPKPLYKLYKHVEASHIQSVRRLNRILSSILQSTNLFGSIMVADVFNIIFTSYLNDKDILNLFSMNRSFRSKLAIAYNVKNEVVEKPVIEEIPEYKPVIEKVPPRKYNNPEILFLSSAISSALTCRYKAFYGDLFIYLCLAHLACNNLTSDARLNETGIADKLFTGLALASSAYTAYNIYSGKNKIANISVEIGLGLLTGTFALYKWYTAKPVDQERAA